MAAGRYGTTYGLAQLGSQMMPQYYAAESRALKSETDRMEVEQLREDMAAKRRAQEEAAAYDEALLNPETAAETLRGRGYGAVAMKAEQAYSQQQAQAMKQQEDFERAEHKRKMRNFVQYSTKGQFGQAAEVMGLDDFKVDGDRAYLTTQGQTVEVPYSVLLASMYGEPEDAMKAIEQYGKEVRKEELERAKLEQRKQEAERRYQVSLRKAEAAARRGGSGGGLTAKMKEQAAYKQSLIAKGASEADADVAAWDKVFGDREVARDVSMINNQLRLEHSSDYPDPEKILELERRLAELNSQSRRERITGRGKSTPQLPPGFKPVKR